jgi:SET domain-containing protein
MRVIRNSKFITVRKSKIHGFGVFAKKRIPAGTYIIEYLGEKVTIAEADRRAERITDRKSAETSHTFFFGVSSRHIIDGNSRGNDARFINHSCDGNCESDVRGGRVFISAVRDIKRGEELTFDYALQRHRDDPRGVEKQYRCLCGTAACRGTMLEPRNRKDDRVR